MSRSAKPMVLTSTTLKVGTSSPRPIASLALTPGTGALWRPVACGAEAERVVVDGKVEGPIQGGEIVLKSRAQVVGDIHHQSLAIESGAFFDGRSVHIRGDGQAVEKLEKKSLRHVERRESLSRRIERAVPVEAE